MTRASWTFFLAMIAGWRAMLLYGALVGLPILRLSGHYFAIATLGVAIATREVCNNLEIFGASPPDQPAREERPETVLLHRAWPARLAIIDDVPDRALETRLRPRRDPRERGRRDRHGHQRDALQSARVRDQCALCGLAGGVYAYWHLTIDPPTVFNLDTNVRLIIMAVLGGIGTPLGPMIGAALLTAIQETLWRSFTDLHAILFGAAIIIVVLLMPRGIVYLIRQRFSWRVFVRNLRQYRV